MLDAPVRPHPKPLIMLDDKVYQGDIKNIDPNEISSVDVLRDSIGTALYGGEASNGVIIIKTKRYQHTDTIKTPSLNVVVDKDALYVIDGEPSKNKLNAIDPNAILSINVLKKSKNADASMQPTNDVVLVITKANAIKKYQKKLSTFSKPYKDYLEHHQYNDQKIGYELDGVFLSTDPAERAKILYEIPDKKIKTVGFVENQYYNGGISRPYIAIIVIKK